MLSRVTLPGFFITGTDTGVGKTVVAGAIANWFHLQGKKVGVCKPAATGCENGISDDAQFLLESCGTSWPMDWVCPERFAEPLAPAVAARRESRTLKWDKIEHGIVQMQAVSDVMIVEGVGGVMVPMDNQSLVLDMAKWLGLPAIVVARPGLGTINHTLLTIHALRDAKVSVAGVVINAYPTATAGAAEKTNAAEIERLSGAKILTILPMIVGNPLDELREPVSMTNWQSHLP